MQYTVFIDNRVSDGICDIIESHGADVIRLPSFWGLSSPVSAHSDMLTAKLPDGNILMSREYFGENVALFEKYGERITLTDEIIRPIYPGDVILDAFAVGDTLYGHKTAVSSKLRSYYKKFVPLKQGYSKCSVAFPNDGCAITSDIGIYSALTERGIDTLLIKEGVIRLEGYNCGFIGGAGGVLPDGTYLFFGDPALHPDGEKINSFFEEKQIKKEVIADEPLYDFGGFVYITD